MLEYPLYSRAMLGIWILMFLGLPDPDLFIRGTGPNLAPSLSQKGVEWTEIMLAK
jgi:hypothetical protein